MKSTYRVDAGARINIPMCIKKQLNIGPGSLVTIELSGRDVIIRNAAESCVVCGKESKKPGEMIFLGGENETYICPACAKKVEQENKKRGGQNGND